MKYEDGSYRGIGWNATRNRSGKDLCLNLSDTNNAVSLHGCISISDADSR